MAKKQKLTKDEQEQAEVERMQKRVENLMPPKADIPAPISIQQAEELKARIIELEATLEQQKFIGLESQTSSVSRNPIYQSKAFETIETSIHQPSTKPEQEKTGLLRNLLRAPTFGDHSKNRIASLQHKILVGLTFTSILALIILLLTLSATTTATSFIIVATSIALYSVAFAWLYQGRLQLVSWLLVAIFYSVIVTTQLTGTFSETTVLLVTIVIAISGVLLKPFQVIAVTTLTIITSLFFAATNSDIPPAQTTIIFMAVLFGLEGLLLTFGAGAIEQSFVDVDDSTTALVRSNKQLQDLTQNLEQRVAERTHDLELASEVGSTIAEKVGNVSLMLTDATEMIRARFKLYYTQVYLLDPSSQTITLRAGTGSAGRQLLQRGHHLLVNSSSLNGRAVSEKKSVIVADTAESDSFLPNPLLPNTRSEMAIPLLVGDKVLGVLDMQSEFANALNEDNLAAFQVLAGQLSVAIQNAILFAQSEEARKQVEQNARQITTVGWQDFLNGIERGEKIGYIFDQTDVKPLERKSKARSKNALSVPITVTGAPVGTIQVAQDEREWTSSETLIVQSTADQLAQHIENLRLLSQAEKYRQEAEQTTRRLTREGWEGYLQTRTALAEGYSFSPNEVKVENEDLETELSTLSRPITVRDEAIGELMINADNIDPKVMDEIFSAVVAQLGDHLENLRLIEETESSRLESQKSQEQYALAVSGSNDGIWDWDIANKQIYYSPRWKAMLGYEEHELTRGFQEWEELIHPEDRDHATKSLDDYLEQRADTYDVEIRLRHKDGTWRWIRDRGKALRDESGIAFRMAGSHSDVTERKQAEEELLKVRLGMDRSNDAVFITETDGTIIYVNPAFESIYGWTAQEALGQTPRILKSGVIPAEQYKHFWGALNNNQVVAGEIVNKTKDGRLISIEGNNNPIVDANGAIIGFLGMHRDITERKKVEEALRQTQQRAQNILESVTLPMVITRLKDNTLTFINQPATDVVQMKYEDVINQPAPNFYYDPQERTKFITDLRTNGEVSNMTVQLLRGNGEKFWALISARMFEYQDEASILTTFMDITDRIHAQEAVIKRAAELQTVAEVSLTTATTFEPDRLLQAVVDLSKEKFNLYHAHIYLADESWNTLLLAAGAGEIGHQMVETGHAIQMDTERSLVARATRERKAIIVNDVRSEPDFMPNPMLSETRAEMAVPMLAGDKVIGVFDVQSEIEGRFTQEDASIFTTLASQVAIALQNARLYVEQAATVTQLRELDRLKSSFLANMSHELRTPLNSILGFADVMLEGLDGPLTENMDNDLGLIQKNGQHLLHLINDVLDMAKIDSGKMNLHVEKFNVNELFMDVISITSSLAKEKSIKLIIEADSNQEVEVNADKIRLRQVMINLVNNAMKFTEKGQVTICAMGEDDKVLISVKDTGIGIPADHLESVFQEFTQVDTTTTRKAGGTGLGLPISRRLINMHSGRLWAESTGVPGEGATFYVTLPIEANINENVTLTAN